MYRRSIPVVVDIVAELLDKLGPKLLAALESLGATPAARARIKGGRSPDAPQSRLAQLRQAHGRGA